jgi:hypothetical protein
VQKKTLREILYSLNEQVEELQSEHRRVVFYREEYKEKFKAIISEISDHIIKLGASIVKSEEYGCVNCHDYALDLQSCPSYAPGNRFVVSDSVMKELIATKILKRTINPVKDDFLVYFDDNSELVHSARFVDKTRVRSKFDMIPTIFEHSLDFAEDEHCRVSNIQHFHKADATLILKLAMDLRYS